MYYILYSKTYTIHVQDLLRDLYYEMYSIIYTMRFILQDLYYSILYTMKYIVHIYYETYTIRHIY